MGKIRGKIFVIPKLDKIKCFILIFPLSLFFFACGQSNVAVELKSPYTNKDNNSVIFNSNTPNKLQFMLTQTSGPEGLKIVNTPFGEYVDFKNTLVIKYKKEGKYTLSVSVITKSDKLVVYKDSISWEYSKKIPPTPIVSLLQGEYTNLDEVTFSLNSDIFSSKDSLTEYMIDGDIKEIPSWKAIPEDFSTLKAMISLQDGRKTFKIKFRNIYGSESEAAEVSIIKDSIQPRDCEVITKNINGFVPGITDNKYFSLILKASDFFTFSEEVPETYFRILGSDGTETDWDTFIKETEIDLSMLDPEEDETILYRIQMKDIAGNQCPEIPLNLTYDSDYSLIPYIKTLSSMNHPFYGSQSHIARVLVNHPDRETKEIEFNLYGDISGNNTNKWMTLTEELINEGVEVELPLKAGNWWIRVNFREKGQEKVTEALHAPFLMYPLLEIKEDEVGNTIVMPAQFDESVLDTITINGCEEDIKDVDYVRGKAYTCSPKLGALQVEVIHTFKDILGMDESNRTLTLEKEFT